MVWTIAQPPRFIDEDKVVQLIRSVAEKRLAELDGEKRFTQPADTVLGDMAELSAVAAQVKVDCKADAQSVREALFQEEAVAYIKEKCRNRYWFWFLLSKLATGTFPIDVLALARAHARAKDALYDNRFGFAFTKPISLIYELKGFPPGFVIELWEKGRILAGPQCDSNGFGLFLNPLLLDD